MVWIIRSSDNILYPKVWIIIMSAFGHKRTLAQCLIWDEFKSLVKCNSISVADIRFAKAVDKIDCDIVSPSAAQSSGFCSNFTSI